MGEPTGQKTFKYKLHPTPAQAAQLAGVLRVCRERSTAALQERKEAWQQCHLWVNSDQQKAQLPALGQIRADCAAIHSQVVQDVVWRLDRANKAFFPRKGTGEKPGSPRFKGRTRYHCFTYPQWGNGASLDNGELVRSKIGRIAVRWSRPLEGTPKTASIIQEPDGWDVCIACAEVPIQPVPLTGWMGIDLGLESFLTLATGEQMANPRHYRKAEKRLVKAQRRGSRRKRGSKRRRKAVRLLQRAHQKSARQRRDFHHKTALALLKQYAIVSCEDWQVANMVQNGHLAKSIHDAGWSQFGTILVFKAGNAGKQAVAVLPAYPSQICSGCGVLVQNGLSVRWHVCPDCGASLHRDHNAALNIHRAGQAHRGAATRMRRDEPRSIPGL